VGGFDPVIVFAIAALGLMVLTVLRFLTRPRCGARGTARRSDGSRRR